MTEQRTLRKEPSPPLQVMQIISEPEERLGVVGALRKEPSPPLQVIQIIPKPEERLKGVVGYALLVLFLGSVIATYAIIILWGRKWLDFPEPFIHWLGAATIGEAGGLFTLIVRKLWS
jgi:hypothetical protein